MPDLSNWTAGNGAVWLEKVDGQTIALRHPAYPAEAEWSGSDPEALRRIIAGYLAKVTQTLDLPDPLLKSDGEFEDRVSLTWLKLRSDLDAVTDPRDSFGLTRYDDAANKTNPVDRTVVFLAVESFKSNGVDEPLGSRLGIRIVAHLTESGPPGGMHVRITSAARSTDLKQALGPRGAMIGTFLDLFFAQSWYEELKALIRSAAGLSVTAQLTVEGVRILELAPDRVLAELYASLPRQPDGLAYALTVKIAFFHPKTAEIVSVELYPLAAHAAPVKANLFAQDPASKAGLGRLVDARPNRSPERLADFLDNDLTLKGLELDPYGTTHLKDDCDLVRVTRSKLLDNRADETKEEIVEPATIEQARMNSFAALSGYGRVRATFDECHSRPLFDTIIAYGLSPDSYFRLASQPLLIRYRARIHPGPGKDGRTVNAQVDFDPYESELVGPVSTPDAPRPKPLHIHFALADLKRSTSRRQPLGLAADPRWSWHEYCHVLLAARTGVLEFRFAHSAGDALAAIVNDPWSKLVDAKQPWMRGCTFPWVYLHRRHDRSVYDGWGWSGRYHRPARFGPIDNRRHKGYTSEQILSTSLFRLYRALGGDTVDDTGVPDRPARQCAADYTVYLILRAIRLLPPAIWSVLETPDQLVSTLIDADIGTWPVAAGPLAGRVGGCAHKVVRWAFEAQGLYATTDSMEVVDGPGKPPPVDIFIDTDRADADGTYKRGGYMPVSLDWRVVPELGHPRWHASANAIQVDNGQVVVEVGNRGDTAAGDVRVQIWWIEWPTSDPQPPAWNPAKWNKLDPSAPQPVLPWPAPAVTFGPFDLPAEPAGTRLAILAMATCEADPANIDPGSGLPCAISPTPIIDVVAGDNNLGLRLYVVP